MENLRSILFCLQDRLHTLAIVGTNLLTEDFRLKKAAEQFHVIAASSSIFSKIDQLVQHLLEEGNKEKEISLIEAITLVDAVVCTQAEYIVKKEGKQEITVLKGGKITDMKYSDLEQIVITLTKKKFSRYDVVNQIYNDKKEILKDFRILPLLIKGLDSYDGTQHLIKKILIEMGEDSIFLCKKDFDPMGGKDMIHRLEVLEELAKEKENDFYISLLENSSPKIKTRAIKLLQYSNKNIDLLIHLAETEKGRNKTTVLETLASLYDTRIKQYFLKKAKKEPEIYLRYLKGYDTEEVTNAFLEELERLLQEMLVYKRKVNSFKHSTKILDTLCLIQYRYSDKMLDVFQKYGDGTHFDRTYIERINKKLIYDMINETDEKYILMSKELYRRCGKAYFPSMLVAEFLTEPEKTYDFCLPYFYDTDYLKVICLILRQIRFTPTGYYVRYVKSRFIAKEMDIRWIEFLTAETKKSIWYKIGYYEVFGTNYSDNTIENLMYHTLDEWANINDKKTVCLFRKKFREIIKEGRNSLDKLYYLGSLKRLGETDFKTLVFYSAYPYIQYNKFYPSYDFSEIICYLKDLPFTTSERVAESKMILEELERLEGLGELKRLKEIMLDVLIHFKKELQEIIVQGKER